MPADTSLFDCLPNLYWEAEICGQCIREARDKRTHRFLDVPGETAAEGRWEPAEKETGAGVWRWTQRRMRQGCKGAGTALPSWPPHAGNRVPKRAQCGHDLCACTEAPAQSAPWQWRWADAWPASERAEADDAARLCPPPRTDSGCDLKMTSLQATSSSPSTAPVPPPQFARACRNCAVAKTKCVPVAGGASSDCER